MSGAKLTAILPVLRSKTTWDRIRAICITTIFIMASIMIVFPRKRMMRPKAFHCLVMSFPVTFAS